jgi:isopentenyldiphosphate isomerase
MNYQKEFSLTENEIERICEIANDKCQTFNPNDDEEEDTLAQWIDTETLKELVNA